MEFVNGVKEKRVLDIREVLEGEDEGKEIRMNGAVHTIRHMGEVAFVILRKSRGLVQCVYEAGITDFDIRELKEESAVEVMGVVKAEERAPQGFEIRLKEIRVLSRPAEPLPLAVSKWKLNTSLETKLSLRPISLRNVRERAKFKIQEQKAAPTYLNWNILIRRQSWDRVPSFTNRPWWAYMTGCLRQRLCSGLKNIIPPGISTNTPAWISRWGISTASGT